MTSVNEQHYAGNSVTPVYMGGGSYTCYGSHVWLGGDRYANGPYTGSFNTKVYLTSGHLWSHVNYSIWHGNNGETGYIAADAYFKNSNSSVRLLYTNTGLTSGTIYLTNKLSDVQIADLDYIQVFGAGDVTRHPEAGESSGAVSVYGVKVPWVDNE